MRCVLLALAVAAVSLDAGTALVAGQGRGGGRGQARPVPTPETTGIITGRVTVFGGGPVRGAEVRLTDASGRDTRLATTNELGDFELRDIGPGSWTATASKAGFITQIYGQERPFAAPQPITVGQREKVQANFVLRRAGAIGGRVFDTFGDPVAGARVQVLRARMNRGRRTLVPTGLADSTDDTGAFRVYALPPGDYYLGATPGRDTPAVASAASPIGGDGNTVVTTRVAVAGQVVTLDRTSGSQSSVGSAGSTYFPGTAAVDEAQRIRLGPGDEQMNLSFSLLPVRRVRVSGMVLSTQGPASDAQVSLLSASDLTVAGAPFGNFGMTQGGRFTMVNVPPGVYYLTARVGTFGPLSPGSEDGLVLITVGDEDISGVTVTTTPTGIIEGRITTDTGAAPPAGIGVRFEGTISNTSFGFNTTTPVNMPPNTFRMPVITGGFVVHVTPPDGWMLQAIELAERDVTHAVVDLPSGSSYVGRIVLTSKVTRVSGTVRASGRPTRATVLVFPDQAPLWSYPARHVRAVQTQEDGTFEIRGLPPHERYLAVAVDYLDDAAAQDAEVLEELRSPARTFSLDFDEPRTLNLDLVER